MLKDQRYDVCIVGAGIAGAMVATRLARPGVSIAVLEAGRRFDRAERLNQKRANEILRTPLWPWTVEGRDGFVDSSAPDIGYTYDINDSRVKGVGGSTLHWGGLINRFWESDFRTASTYGLGVDWPITYADLEPYYCDAESEIGVAGQHNQGDPPRSRELPMPPFPPKFGEDAWLELGERMGIRIGLASHARNTVSFGGRPACSAFSMCNACPIGARYSADFHIESLQAADRIDLAAQTVVRRIVCDNEGNATAAIATDLDGNEKEIRARYFVIAAHAIESARLLLLSNLGNQSDQVGRNLMEHWYTGAGGFIDERIFPGRIGFETLECNHWYDGPDRETRGAIKMSFVDGRDPLALGLAGGTVGAELASLDCREFGHWVGVAGEIEHLPSPDSRVTLSDSEVDRFGDPLPHIRFAISDTDRRTHQRARDIALQLVEARGCRDIQPIRDFNRAHHHMGTCRMSTNPDDGVVNADCRVHGTSNLFAAGASVFPTGGGRQPTLTVAALALRLGDHIAALT